MKIVQEIVKTNFSRKTKKKTFKYEPKYQLKNYEENKRLFRVNCFEQSLNGKMIYFSGKMDRVKSKCEKYSTVQIHLFDCLTETVVGKLIFFIFFCLQQFQKI